MALIGTLIAESLLTGSVLEDVVLVVHKIARDEIGDADDGRSRTCTFLDFEAADDDADRLAELLRDALDERCGWYCDFRSDEETFVVFSGRVFRYPRGDKQGRSEVAAYGRSAGVPTGQLDWPE